MSNGTSGNNLKGGHKDLNFYRLGCRLSDHGFGVSLIRMKPSSQNDRLQPVPLPLQVDRDDDRQLPGREDRRKATIGRRLVVPRPKRRHAPATQSPLFGRGAQHHCRHADRFAQLHVVSAPRVFPPGSVPAAWESIDEGDLPADFDYIGGMAQDICFNNAPRYFNISEI